MTFGGPRLRCCRPISYAAGSSLAHGHLCYKAEQPLNDAEYEEWRSRVEHPSVGAGVRVLVTPSSRANTPTPRRRFYVWRNPVAFSKDELE